MKETLLLTRRDLEAIATVPMALEAVEYAFRAMVEGDAAMPSKVYLDLPDYNGDFRAMPARLDQAVGLKWVNSHPRNPELHGLPSVLGLYILSDPRTALPLAIMDGTSLTALRTGAAAGVASKHLARTDSKSLGLIGAGVQAFQFLASHRKLYAELEVRVTDIDVDRAQAFATTHGCKVTGPREAAACDIVCIATPSRAPVSYSEMIRPGTHINAMGADARGKQELESSLLTGSLVFVDDLEQASHSGEINVGLHEGSFQIENVAGTLGEVICGRHPGRNRADQITIFDSTGLAVQDLALAERVYRAAGDHGIRVDLVGV